MTPEEYEEITREPFILTESEAIALWKFFLECGYISHEFHEDVHKIWAKLDKFVNKHVS
jgi:hypothetical protein